MSEQEKFKCTVLGQELNEGDIVRIKQRVWFISGKFEEFVGWVRKPSKIGKFIFGDDIMIEIVKGVVSESIKIKKILEIEILKKSEQMSTQQSENIVERRFNNK